MWPCRSALPTLRPALEIMPLDAVWQLVWPELDRMPTRPALHLDVCAARREQRVSGRIVSHDAPVIRFRSAGKLSLKRKVWPIIGEIGSLQ